MARRFYCVYCNRLRSGIRGTPEERTDEHFIPEKIGGQWTISVCKGCNDIAGATCDKFLKEVCWSYEMYNSGAIERRGWARLFNETLVPVEFRYQTKIHHFYWCKHAPSGESISQALIKGLIYQLKPPDTVPKFSIPISKIALGSAYYLSNMHSEPRYARKQIVSGLDFADLRALFQRSEFSPGGKGVSKGVLFKTLTGEEALALVKSLPNPEKRRHFISLEDKDDGVTITVCLYSTHFWHVTVPGVSLGLSRLHDDLLLDDLDPVNLEKVGTEIYIPPNEGLEILIDERIFRRVNLGGFPDEEPIGTWVLQPH